MMSAAGGLSLAEHKFSCESSLQMVVSDRWEACQKTQFICAEPHGLLLMGQITISIQQHLAIRVTTCLSTHILHQRLL